MLFEQSKDVGQLSSSGVPTDTSRECVGGADQRHDIAFSLQAFSVVIFLLVTRGLWNKAAQGGKDHVCPAWEIKFDVLI